MADADVVLDCSDNFKTRQAVNAACVKHARPLVAGAAIGFDGQISVYDTRDAAAPCYACLFPPEATFEETRCATMGVFAPLVGVIGSMQAAEALRLLAGVGTSLAGRLQLLDGRTMEWNEMRAPRNPGCSVCGTRGDLRGSAEGDVLDLARVLHDAVEQTLANWRPRWANTFWLGFLAYRGLCWR